MRGWLCRIVQVIMLVIVLIIIQVIMVNIIVVLEKPRSCGFGVTDSNLHSILGS